MKNKNKKNHFKSKLCSAVIVKSEDLDDEILDSL